MPPDGLSPQRGRMCGRWCHISRGKPSVARGVWVPIISNERDSLTGIVSKAWFRVGDVALTGLEGVRCREGRRVAPCADDYAPLGRWGWLASTTQGGALSYDIPPLRGLEMGAVGTQGCTLRC
jgi:hypothetical protein